MAHDPAVLRKNGSRGGKKTAELYGQEFKERRAQLGGQATLLRYGREYMRSLVMRRYEEKNA